MSSRFMKVVGSFMLLLLVVIGRFSLDLSFGVGIAASLVCGAAFAFFFWNYLVWRASLFITHSFMLVEARGVLTENERSSKVEVFLVPVGRYNVGMDKKALQREMVKLTYSWNHRDCAKLGAMKGKKGVTLKFSLKTDLSETLFDAVVLRRMVDFLKIEWWTIIPENG